MIVLEDTFLATEWSDEEVERAVWAKMHERARTTFECRRTPLSQRIKIEAKFRAFERARANLPLIDVQEM